MDTKQAVRIQTSILNKAEKKLLEKIAHRLPVWVSSDMLTFTGTLGAIIIAAGYILSSKDLNFLWLASFGFLVNWYGDSLDGTLARVRHQQSPKYGFFIDHNVDCINEALIFIGVGLSPLLRLDLALIAFCLYLMLSVYVYISAHLKGEFKLTYGKMGPTELRIAVVALNTVLALFKPIVSFKAEISLFGHPAALSILDIAAIALSLILLLFYLVGLVKDGKFYAAQEPAKNAGPSPNQGAAKNQD